MDATRQYSVDSIVEVAKKYFPFITEETFPFVFKLTAETVSFNLVRTSKNTIRDFLIFLYYCKHVQSARCIAVLFGLAKSRISQIILFQLGFWAQQLNELVNLNNLQFHEGFFLEKVIGCVDSSEFFIQTWIGDAFSGKKGYSPTYYVMTSLIW